MAMLITIIKAPDSVQNAGTSKSFDTAGGSIGRGDDNTWVLEDPELYLSSCHSEITFENERFYITDRSTNGTFYNGSPDPMGKGSKLPINDNDTFVIGDYEFSISFQSVLIDQPATGPFDSESSSSVETPFAGGHIPGSDPLYGGNPAETDPLAALDKAQGSSDQFDPVGGFDTGADPFSGPSHSDQASPLNQQVSWPEPVSGQSGVIPDDWDDDLSSSSSPAESETPYIPPIQSSPPLTEPPVIPKPGLTSSGAGEVQNPTSEQQSAVAQPPQQANDQPPLKDKIAQPVASTEGSVDKTLIENLGFRDKNLSDEQIAQINQLSAEVLREMVSGLMQVLVSRGAIKNEFRMNVTTIQPVENNPLKFSANVEDALENMFIKQGNAYKKPIEAVKDGFEGIAEHQVAILAGIREAFKGIVERFDPVVLEQRFAKQKKGGLIPGSQKAKYWESYQDYYNELVGDMDRSFQYLYGDEFVRAYENQLQKMAIARETNKEK